MRITMDSHLDETTMNVIEGQPLNIPSLLKSINRHGGHKEGFVEVEYPIYLYDREKAGQVESPISQGRGKSSLERPLIVTRCCYQAGCPSLLLFIK